MIDATPSSPSANSYVTLDEADAYFADRLDSSLWTELASDDSNRERAAKTATRMLDELLANLPGEKTVRTQKLRWPRYGIIDVDGGYVDPQTIPTAVKEAVFEMMIDLLDEDAADQRTLLSYGITEGKLGPVSFKLSNLAANSVVSDAVIGKLKLLGIDLSPPSGSAMRAVNVFRS